MSDTPKFYSTPKVAEMFDVKPATVRVWIRERRLKATKFGRAWKVSHEELERFAKRKLEESR